MNIFLIGNSLTQDTIPHDYATAWHIAPSQGLLSIYNNPSANFLAGSTQWDTAFAATQYDLISVQPYPSLDEPDAMTASVTVISDWVTLQPNAKFIIHTGWAGYQSHDAFYQSTRITGTLAWNRSFYEELISRLRTANPGTEFGINPCINVNESINQDAKRGIGPFTKLQDIYRDLIHMNDTGMYLQNNLMRRTMGLPQTADNSAGISSETRVYLDQKVKAAVPIGIPFTIATNVDQTSSL